MKQPDKLAQNYTARISDILDISWKILKSRFIDGRHEITKEAPFQHYFAHIISTIGESYCTKRNDIFLVDLETKIDDIKGKSKYLDITCSFPNENSSCAIELKFKTSRQGAQDHGRIDAFVDIEALELVCNQSFDIGRFYMITDSTPYIKKSKKGVGTVFTTHDGSLLKPGSYHFPSKGRENITITLQNEYTIEWEKINEWFFLQINIAPSS
ncbi:hypothetical protein Pan153_02420 [Gimesia panareensis]|uniref:Restriction endonuclease n=1 Tax=Gimesia panareensis TaxID=2527978 RepID=A0A518FH12_9PLAN|nr:hypothetical protein [Gimesia panareensis]QDV15626.1 hypothetical protein Pan153_02420 [Gimesia panareensis]